MKASKINDIFFKSLKTFYALQMYFLLEKHRSLEPPIKQIGITSRLIFF